MSEVKLARKQVVPGKADRLREWYAELQDREDEVLRNLSRSTSNTTPCSRRR